MQGKMQVNSSYILNAMLKEAMTVADAARKVGVSKAAMTRCLLGDRTVNISTAAKLRRAFGNAAADFSI